jgi:hypothetical protein
VIVTNADRWSRGNQKATQGLEVFKAAGIRFFVGVSEYVLTNPEHVLFLDMSSAIGKFTANNQNRKSILNRIHRARRGIPTCGELPYGRTYDDAKGWGLDTEKQRLVEHMAKKYLRGTGMLSLAREHGWCVATVLKVLTKRAGSIWVQNFHSEPLNIHESVPTPVPPLLSEETIKAIKQQAEDNKKFRKTIHQWLLAKYVNCAKCGRALFGVRSPGRKHMRYYRHRLTGKKCMTPWIFADDLEDSVFRQLFSCFGNPVAVQKAIDAAIPNRARMEELRGRQHQLAQLVQKIGNARERILGLISKDSITDEEAERQLAKLRQQEDAHKDELAGIIAELEHVPDTKTAKQVGVWVAGEFKRRIGAKMWAKQLDLNTRIDQMTWEQRRELLELVFDGRGPDGKRFGVYVTPSDGRRVWEYDVLGNLIKLSSRTDEKPDDFAGVVDGSGLLEEQDSRCGH